MCIKSNFYFALYFRARSTLADYGWNTGGTVCYCSCCWFRKWVNIAEFFPFFSRILNVIQFSGGHIIGLLYFSYISILCITPCIARSIWWLFSDWLPILNTIKLFLMVTFCCFSHSYGHNTHNSGWYLSREEFCDNYHPIIRVIYILQSSMEISEYSETPPNFHRKEGRIISAPFYGQFVLVTFISMFTMRNTHLRR